MKNKYKLLNAIDAFRIISLLLVLMLLPLGGSSFLHAVTSRQTPENRQVPSKVANGIINPGLDPTILLSSNSVTLFAADKSIGMVNVTSNITWTASLVDPLVTWLAVNPGITSGDRTLTFTADANSDKINSRSANVLIHANGVADQIIVVTQSQEVPAFTFSSSGSGSLTLVLLFNSVGTFYIDWGDGVPQILNTSAQTYKTTNYNGGIVKVYGSGITSLDARSNNITSLDVSGCSSLASLTCSYNDLSILDLSKNTELNYLSVGYNNLGQNKLDISKNTKLITLSCISNKITTLDVTKNTALLTLQCFSNKLTNLDVTNNKALSSLYCYSNNFAFNTLPLDNLAYTTYINSPQANLPASVSSNIVDLSSQLIINDRNGSPQTTVYKWFTKTGASLTSGIDYTESNGKFSFLKTPSDDVYSAMTNPAFPNFTDISPLRTVNLKVLLVLPIVTTISVPVANVGSTTATANCNIDNLGVPNPTSYGVCWTTNSLVAPLITDAKLDLGNASSTGPFIANVIGLAPGTTYYVRAYATNVAGTGYGVVIPFTTIGRLPKVSTEDVTAIGIYTATGHGTISDLGAPTLTQYGVVWSTSKNPTVDLTTRTSQGITSTLGAFMSSISGLTANTTYYVRAYATNSVGTSYGDPEVSFKTASIQLTIADPTIASTSKIYDGNTSASFTPGVLGNVENTDDVSINLVTSKATYDNANIGTGKIITVTYILTGTSAYKYLAPVNYTINTGVITQALITVTAATDNKIYDGTISSKGAPIITGVLGTGDVAVMTQVYDNATVGNTHKMTPSIIIKNGINDVTSNYKITYNTVSTGVITEALLTITAVFDSKIYDGNISSKVSPTIISGALNTGDVAVLTQVYDNAAVGNTHKLTPSIKIMNGINDVTSNYKITCNTLLTGVITEALLTITAVTDSKIYDGNTSSKVLPTIVVGALITGDVAVLTQVYDNANVGNSHKMSASIIIKNGINDVTSNYKITYNTVLTGVITEARQ